MAKIGFIGLGIMGRPMAGHLLEGGHQLFVHSRRAPPKELTDNGTIACANGKEVGRNARVIIAMVPDTPDVETVLFGEQGVAEGLSPGKTIVDMSSISPIATKEFAKKDSDSRQPRTRKAPRSQRPGVAGGQQCAWPLGDQVVTGPTLTNVNDFRAGAHKRSMIETPVCEIADSTSARVAPKQNQINPSKNAWICLDLFVRIGIFQRVAAEKLKKPTRVSSCVQNVSNRFSILVSPFGAEQGAGWIRRMGRYIARVSGLRKHLFEKVARSSAGRLPGTDSSRLGFAQTSNICSHGWSRAIGGAP